MWWWNNIVWCIIWEVSYTIQRGSSLLSTVFGISGLSEKSLWKDWRDYLHLLRPGLSNKKHGVGCMVLWLVKQRFPWSSTTWASHVKTRRLSHGRNETATCSIRIATSSHGLESPAVWLSHLPLHLLQSTHHSLLFYYWIILPLLSFA